MKFNVNFKLRNKDSKVPEKIYLVCRWKSNELVYPANFSVIPNHWKKDEQKVDNNKSEPFALRINKRLDLLKHAAVDLYLKSEEENIPLTKEYLKNGLDLATGKIVPEKKLSLFEFIEEYIEKSNTRTYRGKAISYRTIQEYKTTLKNLKEFQKEKTEYLDWENLSVNTFARFTDYLSTAKNYRVNNVAKHVDNFIQFLKEGRDEKFEFDYSILTSKKIKVPREKVVNVALNEEELAKIESLQLTGIKEKVRDLFLFGAWGGGLRISDWEIKSHNIKKTNEGEFLSMFQTKTRGQVVIPVFPTVNKILKKWNYELPKVSKKEINKQIKLICKEAKINEQIEVVFLRGGQIVKEVKPKWEMVTAHCARRSYCSNMVRRGYATRAIMAVSGHKKEDTFLKYVVLSPMEYAKMLMPASIIA